MNIKQKVVIYIGRTYSTDYGREHATPADEFKDDLDAQLAFGWRVVSMASVDNELVVVLQKEEE